MIKKTISGRITAGKVSKIAREVSDNGRCWWIESFIKNSFSKNVNMRRRR